ncbi:hypothetical protein ACFYVR_18660 [Rhodococcus sp. NPDC003318]|uniref:hypothetical protein n=1 Tax=Rhodococcus sp. NPDC003318 TaxID=3364503 RepID=UPI0036AF9E40
MRSIVPHIVLTTLFTIAIIGTVFSPLAFDGTTLTAVKVGSILSSLLTGFLLARLEPVKSFLQRRSVQLFLFGFNAVAAVGAYLLLTGSDQIGAVIGLGSVSLMAAVGLVRTRRARLEREVSA